MKESKSENTHFDIQKLTRKEALEKAGKYAAFTASAMITILIPKESQAVSQNPTAPPGW